MADVYIREGDIRSGFCMMYHELFDLYHPYIGDKATLYYLYLLRSRNNEPESENNGKSWRGRSGVTQKFQLSNTTLPLLDAIVEAAGLVTLEHKPIGRGRDKIYYVVHDPKEKAEFMQIESELRNRLRNLIDQRPNVKTLLGKEIGSKLR